MKWELVNRIAEIGCLVATIACLITKDMQGATFFLVASMAIRIKD